MRLDDDLLGLEIAVALEQLTTKAAKADALPFLISMLECR